MNFIMLELKSTYTIFKFNLLIASFCNTFHHWRMLKKVRSKLVWTELPLKVRENLATMHNIDPTLLRHVTPCLHSQSPVLYELLYIKKYILKAKPSFQVARCQAILVLLIWRRVFHIRAKSAILLIISDKRLSGEQYGLYSLQVCFVEDQQNPVQFSSIILKE